MKDYKFHSLSILLFIALSTHAQIPYESIAEVTTNRNGEVFAGTGVLLSRTGLFATNMHVIEDCFAHLRVDPRTNPQAAVGQRCPRGLLRIYFSSRGHRQQIHGATIVRVGSMSLGTQSGPYRDWVLLQLTGRFANYRTPQIQFEVSAGEALTVVGFPAVPVGRRVLPAIRRDNVGAMYESSGQAESSQSRFEFWRQTYASLNLREDFLQRLINRIQFNFFQDQSQIFTSVQIYSGYSGGGIFNSRGEVVGLIWGTLGLWIEEEGSPYDGLPERLRLKPGASNHPGNQLATGIRISELFE